jgi:colicin import membrane protein
MSQPEAVPMSAQLVTYDVSEAWISQIRTNFQDLSAATPGGYEEVRLAIANVRDVRVAIEKRRVELKADALAYGRLVDSEAKRFTTLLLEIEDPLKAKKAAIDDAAARKKAEAEAEKIRAVEAEIAANRAKQEAEARAIREAEEKRLAEERAALAAERKKLEAEQAALEEQRRAAIAEAQAKEREEARRVEAARKAEQERLDAAAAAERARIDAEREKWAALKRAEEEHQRLEREALDAERRRVTAEREKAERAEFERQAKVRAETEAAEKVERERIEKARREAELAALLPDVEKLAAFAESIRVLKAPDVKSETVSVVLRDAMNDLETLGESLWDKAVLMGHKR